MTTTPRLSSNPSDFIRCSRMQLPAPMPMNAQSFDEVRSGLTADGIGFIGREMQLRRSVEI